MSPETRGADSVQDPPSRIPVPEWLKRAAFEAVLIVFGLTLAFALNEWREARQAALRVAEARALVIDELEFNRTTIAAPEFLDHHRSLLRQYQQLLNSDDRTSEPLFDTGVHPAPLRSAAWHALSAPEVIGRLPYQHVVMLAGIYQHQERLEQMHWTAIAWLIAPQPDASDPAVVRARRQSLVLYLGDVVATERRLLDQYAEAAEALRNPADQ